MTADVAAHLTLCSSFSFPQGQSHHLKSMEKHRILKEVNTFNAVTENITSENILIFIFNPLWLFKNIPYIFAALIN